MPTDQSLTALFLHGSVGPRQVDTRPRYSSESGLPGPDAQPDYIQEYTDGSGQSSTSNKHLNIPGWLEEDRSDPNLRVGALRAIPPLC
ncbi:unnamed protein product [Alternaria burnsii]|nr:unnamed protein product [Alternaria burnsii]